MSTTKGKKADSWPILIKQGSATAKIFRTPENGRDRFTVEWYEGTQRKRLTRVDLADAQQEAKTIARTLNAGKGDALELSGVDRDNYVAAVAKLKELKPLEISLATAIAEYVDAKKWNVPLGQAAKSFHEANNAKLKERTVMEVYQELYEARRKDDAGKTYLIDLKTRLSHFAREFKTNIAEVTSTDITDWIAALDLSKRSRRNYRNAIKTLFYFAQERNYLNRERKTAAELSAKIKVTEKSKPKFTDEEFAKLLSVADKGIMPFFVFGGFCGLRSAEIKRLQWQDVRWTEGEVVIHADTSKQGEARRYRVAPLTAPALAWLAGYEAKKGKVLTLDLYKRLPDYTKAAGVKWKDNVLRHSFITFRVATEKDIARVAKEAGNSVKEINKSYDGVATEREGRSWFSLLPETAKNIIQMKAA